MTNAHHRIDFASLLRVLTLFAFGALVSPLACESNKAAQEVAAKQLVSMQAERGRIAANKYGCNACHQVDRQTPARIQAAAPLYDIRNQAFIAGVLANTPANMARWILNPHAVKPQTSMPTMALTPAEADDIATYLLLQR